MTDGINHLEKSRVPLSPEMAKLYPEYRLIGASISYHVNRDNLPKTIDGGISIYLIPKNGNEPYKEVEIVSFSCYGHKEFVVAAREFIDQFNRGLF